MAEGTNEPKKKDDPHPRWEVLDSTIKNLFALSGNRCAFPGCKHSIINETGQVVPRLPTSKV